jgi:hypothetical protein
VLSGISVDDQRTAIGLGRLVHIDLGGPVHDRIVLLRDEQFARVSIQRVTETVTVEVSEQLPRLAIDSLIRENHLVDTVVVPLIVWRHLVDPLHLTGIEIARPDGHRPTIVARPLHRIPGRRITGTVIDEVQRRVVGIPAPGVAAADLPLVAFPSLDRRVGTNRLAERHRLLGVDKSVAVRSFRIAAPRQRAVLHVVCADPAANAELAAGHAYQHFVAKHERRIRAGLAFAGLAVHLGPDELARLRVERNEGRIGLMQEYFAVAIGDAAIDRIAAHDRDDVRILTRFVFPENLALVVQIERVDGIGERRMNVHHVADHERRPFMTAKHSGRKCPSHLQFADVRGRDLVQSREPRVLIVLCGRRPLLRILHPSIQVRIGAGRCGLQSQEPKDRRRNNQYFFHALPP